jgi:phosphohistidine phosphatase
MKRLIILRHAKSSWNQPELADFDRPLNKRGRRDAPRMGKLIAELGFVPDIIISSSAKRARDTINLAANAFDYDGEIILTRDLYAASPDSYFHVLCKLTDDIESALVVGHNPGLEDLFEEITGGYERLPTAALAVIDLDIPNWSDINEGVAGKSIGVWRPKEL